MPRRNTLDQVDQGASVLGPVTTAADRVKGSNGPVAPVEPVSPAQQTLGVVDGGQAAKPPKARVITKTKKTFSLKPSTIERLLNASWHVAGTPDRGSPSALAERALEELLEALEKKHNGGEPFPEREGATPTGRAAAMA